MNDEAILEFARKLHSLPPREQAIGFWLAHQADESGVIEDIDWEGLSYKVGLSMAPLKRSLQMEGLLLSGGFVLRESRMIGNVHGKPRFTLDLNG
ncbi:MAG: hypothetical protein H0U67_16600 [Gemmatimonadetes bacterium]|nr:hypothetical protein [Gemmatimonadota bacterium]